MSDFVLKKVSSIENELEQIGFDMENGDNFEKQYEFYTRALFEGICNGILMCGGKIEGVDDGES